MFTANTETKDVTVDQYGENTDGQDYQGRTAKVTVPFALYDLDRLAKVMPNATYSSLQGRGQTPKKKIEVTVSTGFSLSSAKPLVIKPIDPNATANDWITIFQAVPTADPEYTYDSDKERIVKIEFEGLAYLSKAVNSTSWGTKRQPQQRQAKQYQESKTKREALALPFIKMREVRRSILNGTREGT
nr:hypothetical protein [Paenibacillus larvae]